MESHGMDWMGFWFLGFDGIPNFFHVYCIPFSSIFQLILVFSSIFWRFFRVSPTDRRIFVPSGSLRDVRAGGGERSFGVRRVFWGSDEA